MIRVITDYLDETVRRFPNKVAFEDKNRAITFSKLQEEAYHIAQAIINTGSSKKPIVMFLDKSVECIVGFMGALYSDNFYSPIDVKMPVARINKIMDTLKPQIILTDREHLETAREFGEGKTILLMEEALNKPIDIQSIRAAVDNIIDTDILYVLFTSGSTGSPKGVVINHHSMIDYIEWAAVTYALDETYNFGSQSPFYFCMSVLEIYATMKCGCTTYIIPTLLFAMPGKLLDYMAEKNINIIYWVPSALIIIANLNGLDKHDVSCLKWVLFSGEVMPVKQLNYWMDKLPTAKYVNVYGPTELTADVTYYIVDRKFDDTATLPIGIPCINSEILLLDEDNKRVSGNEMGELCVRGSLVACGYYGDPERTAAVFVQNPLNPYYPEKIYRTGDLAYFNEYGELEFAGRKDFQIKHMGHRIELGEIEANVSSLEGVDENACFYDKEKKQIVLYYCGKIDPDEVRDALTRLVPIYMLPNKRFRLEEMPRNINGKIDRAELRKRMESL